jgi:hypothetical protein
VEAIPRVGGTKEWNFARIVSLRPDLLVLDREENPKFMSEQSEIPWVATHVDSVAAMPGALELLAERVGGAGSSAEGKRLVALGERWRRHLAKPERGESADFRFDDPPALIEWGLKPSHSISRILYVIWRDPWMAVSRDTFIGSVLSRFGWGVLLPDFPVKYPEIDLKAYDPERTLLLFSSEPYPFLKKRGELSSLGFPYAFVDGESLSWFGIRTLNFLEKNF